MGQRKWEEIKEHIRPSVEEFIEKVNAENEKIPHQTVYCVEDGKVVPKEVSSPQQLVTTYPRTHFEEVAEHLAENYDFPRYNDENLKKHLANYIRNFSGMVMEYSGYPIFQETAFDAAFEENFRLNHGIAPEYACIVPLSNADFSFQEVEMDPNLPYLGKDGDSPLESLSINEFSKYDKAAIYTHESGSTGVENLFNYKIHFEVAGQPVKQFNLRLARKVITALRLLDPEMEQVYRGPIYHLSPDATKWRLDVHTPTKVASAPTGFQQVDKEEYDSSMGKENLAAFWESNHHFINIDTETSREASLFFNAIKRFDEAFKKNRFEDQVIDCVIGLESTLLKDLSGGSNAFSTAQRGALLLDSEKTYCGLDSFDFLKLLYRVRNRIVHQGDSIDEVIQERDFSAEKFVQESRQIFADALKRYMALVNESGENITQINQDKINTRIKEALMEAQV